jgi:hypothetical protein
LRGLSIEQKKREFCYADNLGHSFTARLGCGDNEKKELNHIELVFLQGIGEASPTLHFVCWNN